MTWLAVLASFLGAGIGAAIPAWVAVREQKQQARTEWRQRLDRAIGALLSDSATSQAIGQELLADLITSDLGSPDDLDLAERISRAALTGGAVDAPDSPRDNGTNEQEPQP